MNVSTGAIDSSQARVPLTPTQWLICVIAALGFAFDTYELLMLPLVVRPAVAALTGARPGTPEFNLWAGMLFYVPAVAGAVMVNDSVYVPELVWLGVLAHVTDPGGEVEILQLLDSQSLSLLQPVVVTLSVAVIVAPGGTVIDEASSGTVMPP